MKTSVLIYLIKGTKVCLGMKKIRYSQGKWNGFGGKIEPGESKEQAAVREVFEEAGVKIDPGDLKNKASFFYYEPPENWSVEVFTGDKWTGEISESEEMRPEWFEMNKLPFSQMWENDKLWIERVLTGTGQLKGTFWHDENGKVIKYELEEE
jgi:8-oxo-dGTP pyrophosphatase MutT (NUDIX family)